MTEDRLCGLAMIHVHRNDTVGQVIPEAVLKRRDSSGNRKIHLVFTDLVLSLFNKILFKNQSIELCLICHRSFEGRYLRKRLNIKKNQFKKCVIFGR